MGIFQQLDNERLGSLIREAKSRVVLCIPGFDKVVGTALVNAHQMLGPDRVHVIVDASDRSARLGYGHFNAVEMLCDNGIRVRVEPDLRLGVVIIDDSGWCLAVPPLMVDATMEKATAPNAIELTADQISAILSAVIQPPPVIGSPDTSSSTIEPATSPSGKSGDNSNVETGDQAIAPDAIGHGASPPGGNTADRANAEIGKTILAPETVKQIGQSLAVSPPQIFDVARKVNVFNAFLEFVELKLTGVQIGKHKTTLPNDLLLAVSDRDTREKINAQFKLIGDSAEILKIAGRLRERADLIRKTHTRTLPKLGAVILRKEKPKLDAEFEKLKTEVKDFSDKVKKDLAEELVRSRNALVQALVPSLRASPPAILLAEVDGDMTDDVLKRWISDQLDRVFPSADELITQMETTLVYKAVTYETLTNDEFQKAAIAAYPYAKLTKPLEEFVAAKAPN